MDYYLFLLLSKTLRSVVTIEMFYLTRRFCGVNIYGGACYVYLPGLLLKYASLILVDVKKNCVLLLRAAD